MSTSCPRAASPGRRRMRPSGRRRVMLYPRPRTASGLRDDKSAIAACTRFLSSARPVSPRPRAGSFRGPQPQAILADPRPGVPVFQADVQMHPCLSTGLPQAGEGEPHPLEMIVEGDPGIGKTPLRIPEPSLEIGDPFPAPPPLLTQAADQPEAQRPYGFQKLRAERHRQFSRGRRGRRPEVRREVGDGEVRFMADGRDDGDPRTGDRPGHPLVVERGRDPPATRRPGRG